MSHKNVNIFIKLNSNIARHILVFNSRICTDLAEIIPLSDQAQSCNLCPLQMRSASRIHFDFRFETHKIKNLTINLRNSISETCYAS